MTFDQRTSAIVDYFEAAIQALVNARRLVLESVEPKQGPDDLPDLPEADR